MVKLAALVAPLKVLVPAWVTVTLAFLLVVLPMLPAPVSPARVEVSPMVLPVPVLPATLRLPLCEMPWLDVTWIDLADPALLTALVMDTPVPAAAPTVPSMVMFPSVLTVASMAAPVAAAVDDAKPVMLTSPVVVAPLTLVMPEPCSDTPRPVPVVAVF